MDNSLFCIVTVLSNQRKEQRHKKQNGKNLTHHLYNFGASFSCKITLEIKKMDIWEAVRNALKRLIFQQVVAGHRSKKINKCVLTMMKLA